MCEGSDSMGGTAGSILPVLLLCILFWGKVKETTILCRNIEILQVVLGLHLCIDVPLQRNAGFCRIASTCEFLLISRTFGHNTESEKTLQDVVPKYIARDPLQS